MKNKNKQAKAAEATEAQVNENNLNGEKHKWLDPMKEADAEAVETLTAPKKTRKSNDGEATVYYTFKVVAGKEVYRSNDSELEGTGPYVGFDVFKDAAAKLKGLKVNNIKFIKGVKN